MTAARTKQIVRRALARWRPITDTDRWELGVRWAETPETADGNVMGVVAQPQYETATLYVNVALIQHGGYGVRELEYTVVHELCHLLLAQLARLAELRQQGDRVNDADELATKKVASALWRARYGEEPPA